MLRRVALVGALLLLGMQAFRVERTNPPVAGEVDAPAEVRAVLRRACYDCHSHETRWPWYSRVAPVSWLVAYDVHEAREEVDFSAWTTYPPAKQVKKLKEIAEEVEEGEMPLWYYLPLHSDARLSDADRATLRAWTEAEAARLAR